jgi:hypothetical protein
MDEQMVHEVWAEILLDECDRELRPDGVSIQYSTEYVNVWLRDTRGKLWSPYLDQPPGPCLAGDDPADEASYLSCPCDHCASEKGSDQFLYEKACDHEGTWSTVLKPRRTHNYQSERVQTIGRK